MIYFFVGENGFAAERDIAQRASVFDGQVEKPDSASLTTPDLSDLLQGQTLFNDKRLVILRQLSENASMWEALTQKLEHISSDVTVIILETKPDKRTKTYKAIVKLANVKEFPLWTARDQADVVRWVHEEAVRQKVRLTDVQARHLMQRVGYEQWNLLHALEKLSLMDEITNEQIDDSIEAHPDENIFGLLDTALRSDLKAIHTAIGILKQSNDPYQVAGLLNSQILQLATLALTSKSSGEVAKDIGAHPFVLSKLSPHANRLNKTQVRSLIDAAGQTDRLMKSSGVDPWLLIEQLLIKIARQ